MQIRRSTFGASVFVVVLAAALIAAWGSGEPTPSFDIADKASRETARAVPTLDAARPLSEPPMDAAAPATVPSSGSTAAASAVAAVTLADWKRYPGGLMAAADQALRQQSGKQAYELVRIIDACGGLPARLERTRQNLADLQTQGILKPNDRQLAETLLASMQRDQAQCQVLSGDLKGLRRQLLEVAVRAGIDGSGVALLPSGVEEPWVTTQALREAEGGEGMALRMLASGDLPQASRMQRDAAREALRLGARNPDLRAEDVFRIQQHLEAVERHAAVEDWRADPNNPAKAAAADAAYVGKSAPHLQAATDPQVRTLADQCLLALERRLSGQES